MKKVLIVAIVVLTTCMMVFAQGQDKQKAAAGPVPNANSFTDPRDGKTYRTVKIGKLTWMAENLNYRTGNSWCYENKESNCQQYGWLYDWNTAMKACPVGWRLPGNEDWDDLTQSVGGKRNEDGDWEFAGTKLKSKTDWGNRKDGSSGNGTDEYGFSALPGGYRKTDGTFVGAGSSGNWWSATEHLGGATVWDRDMYSNFDYVSENRYVGQGDGSSARCVR